jgi:uncharacterized membrane protein SpoIIM required for sporulation
MWFESFFRSVFKPESYEKRPVNSLVIAAVFVLLGFLFALFLWSSEFSIAMVAFATILLVPYALRVLGMEEFGKRFSGKKGTFSSHNKTILFFLLVFAGMAIEYTLLFAFVPPSVGDLAFGKQISTISDIPQKYFLNMNFLSGILMNNLRLVFVSYILSLFYGIGALFILNYNASVVGMVYGATTRSLMWNWYTPAFTKIMLFLPHLITEVAAYLLAAIAGIILLRAMSARGGPYLKHSLIILATSVALIFIAGFLEVTVPFLF